MSHTTEPYTIPCYRSGYKDCLVSAMTTSYTSKSSARSDRILIYIPELIWEDPDLLNDASIYEPRYRII